MGNATIIWNFLKDKGLSDCGAAGLMGNLFAESGLNPANLQNTYERSLGYTDAQYTAAVDNGTYQNFVHDKAGYGLAQWTHWSRKQNLLSYCQTKKVSIGTLSMQLDFLYNELATSYYSLLQLLKNTASVSEASYAVLTQFEQPADQGPTVQQTRYSYSQGYYDRFKGGNTTVMSNSPLVTYTRISPNKTSPRNHVIDTITIHCLVGQLTAQQGCNISNFTNYDANNGSSCNYLVGCDGSIGLCVDEKDRSWCTSSRSNDHRAITIEVASDMTHPYAVTDAAYKSLIKLLVDICQRNGIKELLWKADKSLIGQPDKQNMTVHRWFANKECPGEYLYSRHGQIAAEVNAILNPAPIPEPAPEEQEEEEMTQEQFNAMMDNYLAQLAAEPASWEKDAMDWAVANGLMQGDQDGRLMPKKFLTRGEFATVMQRYDQKQ